MLKVFGGFYSRLEGSSFIVTPATVVAEDKGKALVALALEARAWYLNEYHADLTELSDIQLNLMKQALREELLNQNDSIAADKPDN